MERLRQLKKNSRAGFTLAELLITVAIISILGAVITVSAVQMVRNMRQASSDKVAESLYAAVTTHLQEVYAFDYKDVETLQLGNEAIGVTTDPTEEKKICYVSKDVDAGTTGDVQKVVLGLDGSVLGADYAGDSVVVEYNPSSLQVYSVFYSSKVNPSQYYTESGSANNTLEDLRNNVSTRKDEFDGYLGYYQSGTQDLPELNENEYGVTVGLERTGDPVRRLRNLDELTAPVTIHIPNEEIANIGKLKFEIAVTGAESGASAKLVYDEQDAANGGILTHYTSNLLKTSAEFADAKQVSFELVLDNLAEGTFKDLFCSNPAAKTTTAIRFYGTTTGVDATPVIHERKAPITLTPNGEGKFFLPGEDVEVHVTAIKNDGVDQNISDLSKNSAKDNSIFAYGSAKKTDPEEHYAAYLAYGRHLQNLSTGVSGISSGAFDHLPIKAYQVDDIDFTKEASDYDENHFWLWPDLYGDKTKEVVYEAQKSFQPIVNENIKELRGDYELQYNGSTSSWYAQSIRTADYVGPTEYTINGLVIKSTSEKTIQDAGVFAAFSGNEIRNITLTNPRISGEGATGGFIGKASLKHGQTLLIDNCALYMTDQYYDAYSDGNRYGIVEKGAGSADPAVRDDSDVTGLWMSGNRYAGGFIGQYAYDRTDTGTGDAPQLTISHSHASTVIDTTDSDGKSGGMIGYAGSDDTTEQLSVLLESVYADSYIYGSDTGGLIGRIGDEGQVDLYYVYTAGFQEGSIQAGFAIGTVHSVKTSYAFTQMSVKGTARAFTTAPVITNADAKVYYFPQNSANSGNAGRITNADNTKNVEDLSAAGQNKSIGELLLEKLGTAYFEMDPGDTGPYNLRDGMALTTYTKPRLKNIVHYGDWEEAFMPGALVYYEKYTKNGSKVRFYGGNYNALYDSLEEGEAVQADGYGLVFKQSTTDGSLPDTIEVSYDFEGTGGTPVTETIDLSSVTPLEAEYGEQTYLIYPLKTEHVNHVLTTDATSFYTRVKITYKRAGSEDNTEQYYFNPHFARAVGYLGHGDQSTLTVPPLNPNGVVYVRSARHLYNLSLYYKYYRTVTEGRTFRQTYDISYKEYDWHGYFNENIPAGNCIVRQNPIALTPAESFKANYNGGCFKIRDVSFVLEEGKNGGAASSYTGLFGYNEGELRNIVLFADYDEDAVGSVTIGKTSVTNPLNPAQVLQNHFYVPGDAKVHYYAGADEDIGKNKELYLGVLVGRNTGTITNCATAGYYMADASGTIVGNSNGYIYAGGLAGENTGTVTNSAADTPFIRLTTNYATAFLGGFAGRNTGRVLDSYAHGHMEVVNPRGGAITMAGFSARNTGELSNCYAAVNIQSSGNTTVYAFSPKEGIERGSSYLGKGTFTYAGHLYSYNFAGDTGAGTVRTREQLIGDAVVRAQKTEDYKKFKEKYKNDPDSTNRDYPFRAVVTDANGATIHYGEWQRNPVLGKLGIFYWEKEETGGNAGVHFSFIGVDEQAEIAGTTLCNAHDDGGIVVDYGYGYYESVGNEAPVETDRDPEKTKGLNIPTNSLDDIAAALHNEAPQYTFYPYRSLPNNAADKSGYLYLSYTGEEVANADNNTDIRNGEWTLKKDHAEWTFYVAPFFANAMSLKNPNGENVYATSQDGINRTDYAKKPGTADNPYEIRTIEQLQYINWNAAAQNVSTMVDGSTYKTFPYLAYTSVLGKGKQKKADAGHNETLKFLQTHDVSGVKTDGTSVIANYTPIASSHTASSDSSYDAMLYAWFGSDYDGQSYKITNINISSPAFSVGVFGVTVSAGLNNIILYSDRDNVIERRNGADMTPGGYSLGGLVGIAYQYEDVPAGTGTIQNCAVAGFMIKDESTNQLTQGESNVGGLIGATRVDVKNCSAVTDIEINCTHTLHSTWGDYVRTGGLIGALPGTATNCYTGGSIKVGDATLAESRRSDETVIDPSEEEGTICDREKSMNVYIAGFAGSAFSMNYQNFTDKTGADDKSPTMINCYSFVEFPPMKGSIRAITAIASLADRYGNDGLCDGLRVNLYNCHYLNPYKGPGNKKIVDVSEAAKYTIRSDNGHTSNMSPYEALNATTNFVFNDGQPANETFYKNMIRGGGAYPSKVTGYRNKRIADHTSTQDIDVHPTELSYDQLSGRADGIQVWDRNTHDWETQPRGDGKILAALNYGGTGTYDWVTTTLPSGAPIDGKYSFPGNHPELDGLNYVFPTIVTQRDLVFNRTVNVHYGRWPLSGMYWSEARSEMDLFGDKAPDDPFAYKELKVLNAGSINLAEQNPDGSYKRFKMEVGGIAAVSNVQPVTGEPGNFTVTIKALKTGTETITADGTAKLILEVKANFSVSTDPTDITTGSAPIVGVDAATKTLNFLAKAVSTPDRTTGATTERDYKANAVWTITIQDGDIGYLDREQTHHEQTYPVGTTSCEVTGNNPGRTQIVAKAKLKYPNNDQGVDYESSVYLPLQTYGVIGLSNNNLSSANTVFWNETSRSSTGSTGQNKDYSAAAQKPTMEDDSWTDFFLYETYADETLGSMTITGIKINGADVTEAVIDDGTKPIYTSSDDNYIIDIGSASAKLSTDGKYRYRSLKLRPKSGAGADVTVQLTVKDGETKASYVLSGSFKGTHVLTADANKPSGTASEATLQWKSLHTDTSSGNLDLFNAGIPTLTGYKFTGWAESATGTATYCTGVDHTGNKVISGVTTDKTLYAIWAPIHYTIAFDPGAGSLKTEDVNLDSITATYDVDATLYNKTQVNEKYKPPTALGLGLTAAPPTDTEGDPATDPSTDPATDPSADPSSGGADPAADPSSGGGADPAANPSSGGGADPAANPATDPSTAMLPAAAANTRMAFVSARRHVMTGSSGLPFLATPLTDPISTTPANNAATPANNATTPATDPTSGTGSTTPATSGTPATSTPTDPTSGTGSATPSTDPTTPGTDPASGGANDPAGGGTDPAADPSGGGTTDPTTDPSTPSSGESTDPVADPETDPDPDSETDAMPRLRGAALNGTKYFVGWNTEQYGSGISYKPGASVRNLTDVDGATVTLYAQWREHYRLIFMDYKDGSVSPQKKVINVSAGSDSYQVVESDLPGNVVKQQRNGVWGYYWTSTDKTTYRFAGWDENRRQEPGSVSKPVTFDAAGNPTFPTITGIDGDNTFYTIWEEQTYTVTLVDCFTGTPQQTVVSGVSGTLTKLNAAAGYVAPNHPGYTLEGWYTTRITEGGVEFAGGDTLLKDGRKFADLLSDLLPGEAGITLYARYSTNIYEKTSDLKDNYDYLVTIKEIGNRAGAYKGKFAYLLTNNTSGYHPSGGIKDLAGVDHTFRDAATHGKFYTDEAGTAAKLLGSVEYMDTSSMPTNIHNPERENQQHTTDPIGMVIPDNAVWTWHKTADFTGKLEMTNNPGQYLYTETGTTPHVRVGNTEGIWKYEQMASGYNLLQSNEASGYYLHDNYWNLNLNKDKVKDEGSDPPNNRSFRITFYEKTKVYLDEAPASTP